MVPGLPPNLDILDVGCGAGKQTLDLADIAPCTITAVDNHAPFLETLQRNTDLGDRPGAVRTVLGDMAALDFPPASFDLIWSEGAAYIMGFAEALRAWRPLLRPKGGIVISEIAWFKKDPPLELRIFFEAECPGMKLVEDHVPIIEAAGLDLVGHFVLPDRSWWTDYYEPLEAVCAAMRGQHSGDAQAAGLLDALQTEIGMHRKHAAFYGYVFWVMRRRAKSGVDEQRRRW